MTGCLMIGEVKAEPRGIVANALWRHPKSRYARRRTVAQKMLSGRVNSIGVSRPLAMSFAAFPYCSAAVAFGLGSRPMRSCVKRREAMIGLPPQGLFAPIYPAMLILARIRVLTGWGDVELQLHSLVR